MTDENVIRQDEHRLELALGEAVGRLGYRVESPGLSDRSNRVTVSWIGVSDRRLAWEVQLIVSENEFGAALAEVFTVAWNGIAQDQRFTPDATTASVSYRELPTGGTRPKNFVSFTVLGSNIDARGV